MISEQIVRVANTPCLLLSVGSEVQILSGTPESTAASLFSGLAAFFVFYFAVAAMILPKLRSNHTALARTHCLQFGGGLSRAGCGTI